MSRRIFLTLTDMFTSKLNVELLDYFGDDLAVANMARISRHVENREPTERDRTLIENLAKNKHSTPFEACVFKFKISCPIYIARQIFRHRSFSYNEVSRMYTSKDIQFYLPDKVFHNAKSFQPRNQSILDKNSYNGFIDMVKDISIRANDLYNQMVDLNYGNEYIRMILPQNLMTEFIMIGNLRNWSHFVNLRKDNYNNFEVVEIAVKVEEILKDKCPIAIEYLSKYPI